MNSSDTSTRPEGPGVPDVGETIRVHGQKLTIRAIERIEHGQFYPNQSHTHRVHGHSPRGKSLAFTVSRSGHHSSVQHGSFPKVPDGHSVLDGRSDEEKQRDKWEALGLSEREGNEIEAMKQLRKALTRLKNAQKSAAKARAANAPDELHQLTRAQRSRLSRRHDEALKGLRKARHEAHCLAVEAGIADRREETYYGDFVEDHNGLGCEVLGHRRAPIR